MRLKAEIRISIKNNLTGESHKIELIKFPNNSRRFWVRFDGVNSKKSPEVTLTQLWNRLRVLLKIIAREILKDTKLLNSEILYKQSKFFNTTTGSN